MKSSDFNIILITLDGFRKDKIDMCENLKSIRDNSIYFSQMITVSPYTLASLHAIFSGTYPSRNGVDAYYHMFRFKKDKVVTLPQILKRSGYYTCCDIINDFIIPTQGFEERNIFDEKTVDFQERHKRLIEKLSKKNKFFLFLHYTEPHKHLINDVIQKYKQDSNNDEYYLHLKENDERYNSYLPFCDQYIGTITKTLQDSGIANKTILIFHADHGTSIGEKKGEMFYGVYLYDYTVNVFSIISIPQKSPKVINTQCRTIDLFPTIVELAGITLGKEFEIQGESLIPLIENPNGVEREVFIETGGLYGPWPSPEKHNVFCVRYNRKKLIYNDTPQTWEFYDLDSDPHELENIYNENSIDVIFLKKRLLFYLKENKIITKITPSLLRRVNYR